MALYCPRPRQFTTIVTPQRQSQEPQSCSSLNSAFSFVDNQKGKNLLRHTMARAKQKQCQRALQRHCHAASNVQDKMEVLNNNQPAATSGNMEAQTNNGDSNGRRRWLKVTFVVGDSDGQGRR